MKIISTALFAWFTMATCAISAPFVTAQADRCLVDVDRLPNSTHSQLENSGFSMTDLEKGLNCLTADFNGDNKLDYAFIKFFKQPVVNQTVYDFWKVAVLMNNGDDAHPSVLVLREKFSNIPILFKKNHTTEERNSLKALKCPYNNLNAGIEINGEGAGTWIYLWNNKKRNFVAHGCLSELD